MPVNILVADDSVTMRRIMELTFAGEDAQVETVESGEACVDKAKGATPDVVFADCSMSGMDGYGVAEAIKSTPGLESTAVILMASQKTPYDENKGRAAGVDDHILKPFDTQHVIDRVNQVLARPRVKAQVSAPAAAAPERPVAAPMPTPPSRPQPVPSAVPERPAAAAAAPKAAPPAPVSRAVANATNGDLSAKLANLGLNKDQVEGVLALSREVIEQVVWEVVPDLAETMIREEIRRLTADS